MVNSEPRTTNWLTSILHFHFHAVFLSFSLLSSMKLYNVASLKALFAKRLLHTHIRKTRFNRIFTHDHDLIYWKETQVFHFIYYNELFLIHYLIINAVTLDFLKHNINKTSADTFYVSPYFDFHFVDCQTSKNECLTATAINNEQRGLHFGSIPTWKLFICLINIRTNV